MIIIYNNDYYNKINKEELEKEKKDLKREKFLNMSFLRIKSSYE